MVIILVKMFNSSVVNGKVKYRLELDKFNEIGIDLIFERIERRGYIFIIVYLSDYFVTNHNRNFCKRDFF